MKVINIILKIFMLFLTSIWGVGCGILFPVFILSMGSEIVPEDIASSPVIIVWLVTAVAGYVIPAVLVMCKLCKTASVMSLAGFAGILTVYSMFTNLYQYTEESRGPSELYLPCIFITIIILAITVVENRDKIKAALEKRSEEKNAAAPSIFDKGEK